MAILAFQKPDKVIMLEGTDTVGRFEFRPLEPGYAQTIGNALRRILLSSLEGFAINSIKITGVRGGKHRYQRSAGVYRRGYFQRIVFFHGVESAAAHLLAGAFCKT